MDDGGIKKYSRGIVCIMLCVSKGLGVLCETFHLHASEIGCVNPRYVMLIQTVVVPMGAVLLLVRKGHACVILD